MGHKTDRWLIKFNKLFYVHNYPAVNANSSSVINSVDIKAKFPLMNSGIVDTWLGMTKAIALYKMFLRCFSTRQQVATINMHCYRKAIKQNVLNNNGQ